MVNYDNLGLWFDGDLFDMAPNTKPNYFKFIYEPNKTNFYKIVTKDNIPEGYDSVNIKSGTILKFNESDTQRPLFGIQGPFFHFAKDAFNTILWRESLDIDWDGKIYRIKPLTPVVGNISEGKAQFGAEQIMFLETVPLKQMMKKALQEFNEKPEQIKVMNPLCYDEEALSVIIGAWKKNKCSFYVY